MVKTGAEPLPVRVRRPRPRPAAVRRRTAPVHLHDLTADAFVALYFTDTRRRPAHPGPGQPGAAALRGVSRWDAPHDSGLRDRALFDPAERVRRRFGVEADTLVLLRPDGHVAAIVPYDPASGEDVAAALYDRITGRTPPRQACEQTQPDRSVEEA